MLTDGEVNMSHASASTRAVEDWSSISLDEEAASSERPAMGEMCLS